MYEIVSPSRVAYLGIDGAGGRGVSSITEYYYITKEENLPEDLSDEDWKTKISELVIRDADGKDYNYGEVYRYLWNYEVITYNDNTTEQTDPEMISSNGRGILEIVEYYAVHNDNKNSSTIPVSRWSTSPQTTDNTNKYLWNYEVITYGDGKTETTNSVVIGTHGEKGDPGDGAVVLVLNNDTDVVAINAQGNKVGDDIFVIPEVWIGGKKKEDAEIRLASWPTEFDDSDLKEGNTKQLDSAYATYDYNTDQKNWLLTINNIPSNFTKGNFIFEYEANGQVIQKVFSLSAIASNEDHNLLLS